MTEGCHGATIPCDTAGLTPCSDCCGTGPDNARGGATGGTGTGLGAGTATGASSDLTDVPFLSDEENAELALQFGRSGEAGFQGEPLEAYDSETASGHTEALVEDGTRGATDGMDAPEPRYGIYPEVFASMTDTIANFGIESLPCPDRIPETWGTTEPAPEPLPAWDAPLRAPDEYWFYEMDAYSPDRLLSMQVAGAVEPAMGRWPGATGEMMRYALDHGFMTAPASTCYHLNTPGGLACHSASVTACALEMMGRPESEPMRRELGPDWREITSVVCLWHDACKMDFYEPLDHPKVRADGNVAYYGVASGRQSDPRHGELSADIVRRFYGKALPEVAYEAISMHMGEWDHRRSLPKWAEDALDEDVRAQRETEDAEKRAKQDADVADGRIWWQLRKKAEGRRELAARIRGKGEDQAAEEIASSDDPHGKRMSLVLGRLRKLEGSDDPMEAECRREIRQMIRDCSLADGTDDVTVAQGILANEREHIDAMTESRRQKALRMREGADEFARQMERAWEEHPFIRLVHEADAMSAKQGR